ncbi:hypothetical protein [Streptomyces sp. NPDC002328]|uniref:hypothetical protein n=1 Tax=Streptomyces sp. NPDC002328 TaxID=3364642 RepID=UPI0036AC18BA
MSGTAVPWWAVATAVTAAGGTAWWLAARERGPVLVGSVAVAAQAVLHSSFSLAQAIAQRQSAGGRSLARRWLGYLLCGSPSGPGAGHDGMSTSALSSTGSMGSTGPTGLTGSLDLMGAMGSMGHAMNAMHPVGSMGSMDHTGAAASAAHSLDHGMGGMSSTGMLAAHLLAALLCGLWLAHGERAAFRILRALAGRLVAPLRLMLRLPAPPHRPRVRARRGRTRHALRELLLTHAITSRGPPVGTAVA